MLIVLAFSGILGIYGEKGQCMMGSLTLSHKLCKL